MHLGEEKANQERLNGSLLLYTALTAVSQKYAGFSHYITLQQRPGRKDISES